MVVVMLVTLKECKLGSHSNVIVLENVLQARSLILTADLRMFKIYLKKIKRWKESAIDPRIRILRTYRSVFEATDYSLPNALWLYLGYYKIIPKLIAVPDNAALLPKSAHPCPTTFQASPPPRHYHLHQILFDHRRS